MDTQAIAIQLRLGVQVRSKKIFGIYNPPYIPESVSFITKIT